MTKQEEIDIVHGGKRHVVILGAGASFASTLRNPEKGGRELPLMNNIVEVVGLNNVVDSLPKDYQLLKNDFEKLYSKISDDPKFQNEKQHIENAVYSYFESMDLPDEPTIYDYLILSLRNQKDIIATFNWDPFLLKAYYRNAEFVDSPGVLFLHGCVSLGFNKEKGTSGPAGLVYPPTGKIIFEPTKLLYPVDKKDYNSDKFILGQWEALKRNLGQASRVTIFGYSAPKSDVEAITLLQNAWGSYEERDMEEFEFIDVQKEEKLLKSWETFVHSHHYNYATNYFDSSLTNHPRRSVESYNHWSSPITTNEAFQDGNPIPKNFSTIEELQEWHLPLIEAENKFYKKGK